MYSIIVRFFLLLSILRIRDSTFFCPHSSSSALHSMVPHMQVYCWMGVGVTRDVRPKSSLHKNFTYDIYIYIYTYICTCMNMNIYRFSHLRLVGWLG